MKESFYNFVLYDNNWGYWYNALTGFYFRLSKELSKKIQNIISIKEFKNLQSSLSLYNTLLEHGFIIEDSVNELELIRQNHFKAVNEKQYFLIILPTLNCNYKCWYCIQDHVPSIMSSEIMAAVCKHIDHMIVKEHIKSLHLDWFGGEPFMLFDKIIKPISEFAIKKCEQFSIPFINSATTNGYFINNKVSKQLSDLKFSQFQITLDGEKKFHDKVKFTKGCNSTFDYVLSNINRMLTDNKKIRVFLRINYTHETFTKKIVEDVNSHIHYLNRNRIIITPKKVWQEKVDKFFTTTISEILDVFQVSGYKVARKDISNTFTPCYVNQKYYNSINYNGHVIKCTACDDLYSNDPYGVLKPNGLIEWRNNFDKKCIEPTFENKRCLSCKILPACMGLCPRDHMNGLKRCKYEALDEDFEKSLLDYLSNEYI